MGYILMFLALVIPVVLLGAAWRVLESTWENLWHKDKRKALERQNERLLVGYADRGKEVASLSSDIKVLKAEIALLQRKIDKQDPHWYMLPKVESSNSCKTKPSKR